MTRPNSPKVIIVSGSEKSLTIGLIEAVDEAGDDRQDEQCRDVSPSKSICGQQVRDDGERDRGHDRPDDETHHCVLLSIAPAARAATSGRADRAPEPRSAQQEPVAERVARIELEAMLAGPEGAALDLGRRPPARPPTSVVGHDPARRRRCRRSSGASSGSPTPSSPRACRTASRADVPEPHGERSTSPSAKTVTLRWRRAPSGVGQRLPEDDAVDAAQLRLASGWTTWTAASRAGRSSRCRAMSAGSEAGRHVQARASRTSSDAVERAAERDVERRRVRGVVGDRHVAGQHERRHVPEAHGLDPPVLVQPGDAAAAGRTARRR